MAQPPSVRRERRLCPLASTSAACACASLSARLEAAAPQPRQPPKHYPHTSHHPRTHCGCPLGQPPTRSSQCRPSRGRGTVALLCSRPPTTWQELRGAAAVPPQQHAVRRRQMPRADQRPHPVSGSTDTLPSDRPDPPAIGHTCAACAQRRNAAFISTAAVQPSTSHNDRLSALQEKSTAHQLDTRARLSGIPGAHQEIRNSAKPNLRGWPASAPHHPTTAVRCRSATQGYAARAPLSAPGLLARDRHPTPHTRQR